MSRIIGKFILAILLLLTIGFLVRFVITNKQQIRSYVKKDLNFQHFRFDEENRLPRIDKGAYKPNSQRNKN